MEQSTAAWRGCEAHLKTNKPRRRDKHLNCRSFPGCTLDMFAPGAYKIGEMITDNRRNTDCTDREILNQTETQYYAAYCTCMCVYMDTYVYIYIYTLSLHREREREWLREWESEKWNIWARCWISKKKCCSFSHGKAFERSRKVTKLISQFASCNYCRLNRDKYRVEPGWREAFVKVRDQSTGILVGKYWHRMLWHVTIISHLFSCLSDQRSDVDWLFGDTFLERAISALSTLTYFVLS